MSINTYAIRYCPSHFLKGATPPDMGRVRGYTLAMLGIASIATAMEKDPENESRKDVRNVFAGLGALTAYAIGHMRGGGCPESSLDEYKELLEKLKAGTLESPLKTLKPIPSRKELQVIVDEWKASEKKSQRNFLFYTTALQLGMGLYSESNITKLGIGISVLTSWSLVFIDIDNLRNDKDPYWVDFSILPAVVNNEFIPTPTISLTF